MAQVIGKIAKDAETKSTKNGKEFVAFTLAENYNYKTKDGERKQFTTFYNCTYWRKTGLIPYLTKGAIVVINGQISARPFSDRQGNPKASVDFRVNDINPQWNKQNEAKDGKNKPEAKPANENEPADDLPF